MQERVLVMVSGYSLQENAIENSILLRIPRSSTETEWVFGLCRVHGTRCSETRNVFLFRIVRRQCAFEKEANLLSGLRLFLFSRWPQAQRPTRPSPSSLRVGFKIRRERPRCWSCKRRETRISSVIGQSIEDTLEFPCLASLNESCKYVHDHM